MAGIQPYQERVPFTQMRATLLWATWLGATLLGVTLMVLLTGCMKYHATFVLYPDNRASAVFEGLVADSAVTELGLEPAEFWSGADLELLEALPSGSDVTHETTNGFSGINAHVPATDFGMLTGFDLVGLEGPSIVREGNIFYFTAYAGMAEEVAEFGVDFAAEVADAEMTLTLQCPGAVLDSNGVISGNTVHWNLVNFERESVLAARCSAIDDGTAAPADSVSGTTTTQGWFARWWPILLIGLLALLGLAALGYFLRRNSHRQPDSDFEDQADDPQQWNETFSDAAREWIPEEEWNRNK